MSFMFEVLYHAPSDVQKEAQITAFVREKGGQLTHRDVPSAGDISQAVCLTYEFPDLALAEAAASALRQSGEHVEGPMDYGDD
jgi:hypothetical protein